MDRRPDFSVVLRRTVRRLRLGRVLLLTSAGRLELLGSRGKASGTTYPWLLWVRRCPSRAKGKAERGSYFQTRVGLLNAAVGFFVVHHPAKRF